MTDKPETAESSAPSSDSIVVTGEGGFDIATLQHLTEQEPDAPETESAVESAINDPEVPREILESESEEGEDAPEEQDNDAQPLEAADGDEGDDGESSESEGEADEPAPVVETLSVELDGKTVEVPKEGIVTVPVNGKKEKLTFQEVINRASGAINIERENSALGRRKKEFENIEQGFLERVGKIETDLEALQQLDDPYEICEYVAQLQGKDSAQVFEDMVKKTAKFLERRSRMTPEQIELERENRRLKLHVQRTQANERVSQEKQEQETKKQQLESTLSQNGFTTEDFYKTIEDLKEMEQNGEDLDLVLDTTEAFTKDVIINYMISQDLDNRVSGAIEAVKPALKDDAEIFEKLKRAVIRTDSLTGQKMSEAEIQDLVRYAIKAEKKATSESLSRKVRNRPKSQPANSLEQDEDDEGLDLLDPRELFAQLRNL